MALKFGVARALIPLHAVLSEITAIVGRDSLNTATGRQLQKSCQPYEACQTICGSWSHVLCVTPLLCDRALAMRHGICACRIRGDTRHVGALTG